MIMITEDIKKMLHESIDAAKGFGACQYVKDGEPQCVVAQFAFRCGVSVEEMRSLWGPTAFSWLDQSTIGNDGLYANQTLLTELQTYWDNSRVDHSTGNYKAPFLSEDETRSAMHEYVNSL